LLQNPRFLLQLSCWHIYINNVMVGGNGIYPFVLTKDGLISQKLRDYNAKPVEACFWPPDHDQTVGRMTNFGASIIPPTTSAPLEKTGEAMTQSHH
jgi:hypothetical protein